MSLNEKNLLISAALILAATTAQAQAKSDISANQIDEQRSAARIEALMRAGVIKVDPSTGNVTVQESILDQLEKSGALQRASARTATDCVW